jgi:sensor histidine kinase YesM
MELIEELIQRGFLITETHPSMIVLKGERYRIRILQGYDQFQVAFNETFDRWANSVDFEIKTPKNEKALNQIFEELSLMKKCFKCDSWNSPHQIANKPLCADCFIQAKKPKTKSV